MSRIATEEILRHRRREAPRHKQAFLEVDEYIYSGGLAGLLTVWGHWMCARLRKFDRPGYKVLDLGCGPGRHFRFIKEANFIGMDNMPEMLERARKAAEPYGERGKVLEGDIFENPLPDNSMDSIASLGVFEHLLSLEKALSETKRVLKPGGELILVQPCEGPLYRLGRKFTTQRYIEKKLGVNYQEYIETEHVNRCGEVLKRAKTVFKFDRIVGIPFWTPIISINAFMVVRYTKGE